MGYDRCGSFTPIGTEAPTGGSVADRYYEAK
jgi:hypothetical protein